MRLIGVKSSPLAADGTCSSQSGGCRNGVPSGFGVLVVASFLSGDAAAVAAPEDGGNGWLFAEDPLRACWLFFLLWGPFCICARTGVFLDLSRASCVGYDHVATFEKKNSNKAETMAKALKKGIVWSERSA